MNPFRHLSEVSHDDSLDISDEQVDLLLALNDTFTLVSLIAGIVVSILFIRSWSTCTNVGKMSFYLTLSNLIYTFTNFLPLIYRDYFLWCNVDGFFRTFSTLACIVWSTKIALTAFRAVITQEYYSKTSVNIVVGFGIPFLVAIIPLIPSKSLIYYDNLGLSCDVYSEIRSLQIIWPLCVNVVPICLSILLTSYSYGKIISFLKELGEDYKVEIGRFMAYPICMLIIWLPITIFRIIYFFDEYIVWFDGAGIIFSRSSGLINAIIYGWDRIQVSRSKSLSEDETDKESESTLNDDGLDLSYCSFNDSSMRRDSLANL